MRRDTALTWPISPMRAVAGPLPDASTGWSYEIKWDGMRALAWLDGATLRWQSANGRDVTVAFPDLDGIAGAVAPRGVVLDGEIVAFDERGVPSFGCLQSRLGIADAGEAARRASRQPVVYLVFDVLAVAGVASVELSYDDRRRLLAGLVEDGPAWKVPPAHDDGAALLELVRQRDLEGIVAKRRDSRYQMGKRSPAWRKVKLRRRQEFVVGGWSVGEGRRTGLPGALLVGYHRRGRLIYAGRVGTGFTDNELERLAGEMAERSSSVCPFDPAPSGSQASGARWVRPELVVEVEFAEWTGDGRLRHPSYLGQRYDVDAAEVRAE